MKPQTAVASRFKQTKDWVKETDRFLDQFVYELSSTKAVFLNIWESKQKPLITVRVGEFERKQPTNFRQFKDKSSYLTLTLE